jgi:hypothetical protein
VTRTAPSTRSRWAALAFALLALLLLAAPVEAGRRWCARDPIVRVNGTQLQIWVAIPEQYLPFVNGPIRTTVLTPAGVTREVVYLDEGFNGYGEVVTWGDLRASRCRGDRCPRAVAAAGGSFDVRVSAVVPFDHIALREAGQPRAVPLQLTVVFEDGSSDIVEASGNHASTTVTIQSR